MIRAISVSHVQDEPVGIVSLTYDDRYRRRLALQCQNGFAFLLDLPKVIELRDGDDLVLEDGRHIRVKAAAEPLMKASCMDHHHLLRLIWHVGNRHVPCEIHPDHVILRSDHVIAEMLRHLGADVVLFEGAFNPEGGAYGQGRTHGHAH